MAFYICRLFLLAADLTLASALSCALYALTCLCIGSVVGLLLLLCSLGLARSVRKRVGQAGRRLAAKSPLGKRLERRRSERAQPGAPLGPEGNWDPVQKEGCTPATRRAQLAGTGSSGVIKEPSVSTWEDEKEARKEYDGSMPHKQTNRFLSPVFWLALLWAPVDLVCPCLKKTRYRLLSTLLKSQD